jgi:hypothetical protein
MRNNDSRAAVRLELADPLLTDVENWRRSQPKIPARATAVRLLVELAINSKAELNAAKAENGELP